MGGALVNNSWSRQSLAFEPPSLSGFQYLGITWEGYDTERSLTVQSWAIPCAPQAYAIAAFSRVELLQESPKSKAPKLISNFGSTLIS